MDNYICMIESLQCSPETIITVLISYTSMKNGFGVNFKKLTPQKQRGRREIPE